jgi:hypothetical protein
MIPKCAHVRFRRNGIVVSLFHVQFTGLGSTFPELLEHVDHEGSSRSLRSVKEAIESILLTQGNSSVAGIRPASSFATILCTVTVACSSPASICQKLGIMSRKRGDRPEWMFTHPRVGIERKSSPKISEALNEMITSGDRFHTCPR